MVEEADFNTLLRDDQLDDVGGGAYKGNCGILESQFPEAIKCCSLSITKSGCFYKKQCAYCNVWTSLPEGEKLRVSYIIECAVYGFYRRIVE